MTVYFPFGQQNLGCPILAESVDEMMCFPFFFLQRLGQYRLWWSPNAGHGLGNIFFHLFVKCCSLDGGQILPVIASMFEKC